MRESERLENLADTVADRGRGRERKVDDSKLRFKPFGDFATDQFADARYAETRRLDFFRKIRQRELFARLFGVGDTAFERALHDARPGNADVDRRFRLSDAHVRARHERVVVGNIRENDEFRGGEPVVRRVHVGDIENRMSERMERVHIDPRFARRGVDRRANAIRRIEDLGQRLDNDARAVRNALVHQRGKTADKIDAATLPRLVERLRQLKRAVLVVPGKKNRRRRNRETLVRDRNPVFTTDFVANVDEPARARYDLMIDLFAHLIDVCRSAVVQIEGHRHRANVQMFGVQHADSGKDFVGSKHRKSRRRAR